MKAGGEGMTDDEMVGWYHQLNGHEFEQALAAGDGQGNLVCCSPWGHRESDMTELNWARRNTKYPKVCVSLFLPPTLDPQDTS